VAVNGDVTGFSDRASSLAVRLNNAKTKFTTNVEPNLYTRLLTYTPAGYTLRTDPSSKQITYDQTNGVVRYAYTYSAFLGGGLIDGSVEEDVSVNDIGKTDVFAQIPIPGRSRGPIVQPMRTYTLPERTVTINARMSHDGTPLTIGSLTSAYLDKPDTNSIINALKPSAGYYYIKQDAEDWNPIRKQYSRVISWILQPEGSGVNGLPSGLSHPSPI
jgi:hypothetical protein